MMTSLTIDEQIDPVTGDSYLQVVTTDTFGNQIVERY